MGVRACHLVEAVFKRANSGNAVAKIAAHAAAGGTLTELQGGKFGHGFVAAGFTEALSPAVGNIEGGDFGPVLSRTAVSAAIGGTASTLSGGSFANGAMTGAFQQLFNDGVHGAMSSYMKRVPTYDEAKGHWQHGGGSPVSFSIEAIDWSAFDLDLFLSAPGVKRALNIPDHREGDLVFVDYLGKGDNVSYKVPGNQYETLGNITMKIEGTLERLNSGWDFTGEVQAFDDFYDFNSDWSRPKRQILTAAARYDHGPGVPYWLQPRGYLISHLRWKDGR